MTTAMVPVSNPVSAARHVSLIPTRRGFLGRLVQFTPKPSRRRSTFVEIAR